MFAEPSLEVFPLTVRNRRQGDRFQPYGMRGTKKIKNFLIDAKVPRYDAIVFHSLFVAIRFCGSSVIQPAKFLKLNLTPGNTFTYVMPATKPPSESVLISESCLQNRIRELGVQISTDYENQELVPTRRTQGQCAIFRRPCTCNICDGSPAIRIAVSGSDLNSCNS